MDLEKCNSAADASFGSIVSMENNFSFVELLNRVAHDAENQIPRLIYSVDAAFGWKGGGMLIYRSVFVQDDSS